MTLNVPIQKLSHGSHLGLPFYATDYSAGMDLRAAIGEDIILKPAHRHLIPTGIAIALPSGFEAQIRSRSGLSAKNGVVVLNSPGTIDADYRGEVIVILHNHGTQDFTVTPGMRIAQIVIAPVTKVVWQEQAEFSATQRDTKGFGSTGL